MIPVLTTPRLTLRAPQDSDLDVFAAFYGSDRAKYVGGPKTREESWRQLAAEVGHWYLKGYGRWMVTLTGSGELIGNVGLWNPEGWPEPEIGWDLYAGHEGRGYATEAALAARAHAYDVLGWTTAISLVDPANTASARVAQRLGCTRDGETLIKGTPVHIWRHPAPHHIAEGGTASAPRPGHAPIGQG